MSSLHDPGRGEVRRRGATWGLVAVHCEGRDVRGSGRVAAAARQAPGAEWGGESASRARPTRAGHGQSGWGLRWGQKVPAGRARLFPKPVGPRPGEGHIPGASLDLSFVQGVDAPLGLGDEPPLPARERQEEAGSGL